MCVYNEELVCALVIFSLHEMSCVKGGLGPSLTFVQFEQILPFESCLMRTGSRRILQWHVMLNLHLSHQICTAKKNECEIRNTSVDLIREGTNPFLSLPLDVINTHTT